MKIGPPKVEERLQVFPSSMSFLLTVGFLKVGNQPITGNAKKGRTPVIYISSGDTCLWVTPGFCFLTSVTQSRLSPTKVNLSMLTPINLVP